MPTSGDASAIDLNRIARKHSPARAGLTIGLRPGHTDHHRAA
jgi:hypothetical protein